MDIYIIEDTDADSWNPRVRTIAYCISEAAAIQWLEDNRHQAHAAPDDFWWKKMEVPQEQFPLWEIERGVVRDYRYFQIRKITLTEEHQLTPIGT